MKQVKRVDKQNKKMTWICQTHLPAYSRAVLPWTIHLTVLPSMFENYPPIGPVCKFSSEITLNNINGILGEHFNYKIY
jgi:hypothetical protein